MGRWKRRLPRNRLRPRGGVGIANLQIGEKDDAQVQRMTVGIQTAFWRHHPGRPPPPPSVGSLSALKAWSFILYLYALSSSAEMLRTSKNHANFIAGRRNSGSSSPFYCHPNPAHCPVALNDATGLAPAVLVSAGRCPRHDDVMRDGGRIINAHGALVRIARNAITVH